MRVHQAQQRLQPHAMRTVMSDSLLRMVGSVPALLRVRGAAAPRLLGSSSSEDSAAEAPSTPDGALYQDLQCELLSWPPRRGSAGMERQTAHDTEAVPNRTPGGEHLRKLRRAVDRRQTRS